MVRVYLFSSVMIIVSAVVFISIGKAKGGRPFLKTSEFVVATVAENWDQPYLMQQAASRAPFRLSLYDNNNKLIASKSSPPLQPLASRQLQRLRAQGTYMYKDPPPHTAVNVIYGGESVGYGLYCPFPKAPPLFLLHAVMVVFIIIALFSFILARSLAVPIGRLSETADAFGKGDFSVRAGMKRKDELGTLAKTFDEMADRVNALMQSQRELLANVSHELRTPMSRIRVALDIAAEDVTSLDAKQCALIAEDLSELEGLVDDVLIASRLELDAEGRNDIQLPLRCETILMKDFMIDIIDRYRAAHETHRIKFFNGTSLQEVSVDPVFLRRVVYNILDNAIKYSSDESLITVRMYDEQDMQQVVITDQGIGIEEKELENIFKPFYRTDRSRARTTGGVGLGLTLSKRIIEAHGGDIFVKSIVGSGTTIGFSIPHNVKRGQGAV